MKKNLFLISSIVCFLFACKKESDITPDYPSCKVLKEIQKISFGENDTLYPYYEYEYEGNKIMKRTLYSLLIYTGFEGPTTYVIKEVLDSLIYDGNKVYENYHSNGSNSTYLSHERFFYSGDKIDRISFVNYYMNKISSRGEETFIYSDDKLVESNKMSINNIGEIVNTNKTYSYSDDNLSKIDLEFQYSHDTNYSFIYYGPDTTTFGVEIYDNYDEKENPYKAMFFIEDIRIRSLSKNNYKSYDAHINERNGYTEGSETKTISGYNENGYPLNFGYVELVYDCDNWY